jgi:hypothetical protein
MAQTLRDLLIQRAARLQERPAFTTPDWGTLSYTRFRNRVEGVALGLLAIGSSTKVSSATGTPWDWAAEVAAAASGLVWDPTGPAADPGVLGDAQFNAEAGRGLYHACEELVQPSTPFTSGLNHGEVLSRLGRLNVELGWDHDTRVDLPLLRLGEAPVRAALWSALYAGAHAVLESAPKWDDQLFSSLWRD